MANCGIGRLKKMERDVRGVDPIERQIELAFQPGTFTHDRACFGFVRTLDEVEAEIGKLNSTDPARATMLYETLLAACRESRRGR